MVNRIVTLNIVRSTGNYEWSVRQRRSPFRSFAVNPEPLHNGIEGRSVQSQPDGSSTRPTDNPIGFTKRRHNVLSLGVGERSGCPGPSIPRSELYCWRIQHSPRRQYHGALNDILQFSNI